MKATVNTETLLRELKKMSILIRRNPIVPITGSVLFNFENKKLTITACDLETTYISTIDCDCKDSFSFPIDHYDITDICSKSNAPMRIELSDKKIAITSGKSKHNLTVTGDADHFPKSTEHSFDLNINVDCEFFFNISKANLCRAKDNASVNLNMAAIDIKKKSVTVVGCDGSSLFRKVLDCKSNKESVVMVSDTFVNSCKHFQDTEISLGDKFIKAVCGDETVVSLLSVQKYPDYNRVLPTDRKYNLLVNTNELKSAIRSVSVSSNAISKAVYIDFKDGNIVLSCDNVESGKESDTEIDIDHKVETEKICLNLVQLSLLLSLVDAEEIEMSIISFDQSVLMKPSDDDSILMLIQPLTIN